jgi:hypothetical protein
MTSVKISASVITDNKKRESVTKVSRVVGKMLVDEMVFDEMTRHRVDANEANFFLEFLKQSPQDVPIQGSLTEGKGSVQLASSLR